MDEGRLPLSELVRVSSRVQTALKHVATVIAFSRPSGGYGRLPKAIEQITDLHVVAPPSRGSFTLELQLPDLPSEPLELPGMELEPTLGEQALTALVRGLGTVTDEMERLPEGFDRGVLRTIAQLTPTFKRGVEGVDLSLNGGSAAAIEARLNREHISAVGKLVKRPLLGQLTLEGVLRMVDLDTLEFRIDRPALPGVSCFFPEKMRGLVVEALDQAVRVGGEAEFLPNDLPKRLQVESFEPLREVMGIDARQFWESMTLDSVLNAPQVMASPGIRPDEDESEGLWTDDSDFAEFLQFVGGRARKESP